MDPFLTVFNDMLVNAYQSICKVEELMLRKLSDSKLSLSEMHMLASIGKKRDADMTITDIAQDLDITPPSVTAMVKRLEKKGYIVKEKCGDDARRVNIALTPEGRRAEIAHRYYHRQMVRAITRDLTEQERDAIITGLTKMIAFMRTGIERFEAGKEDCK